jgi:hypothetical protein
LPLSTSWQPRRVLRFIQGVRSSTRVMRVETDAGEGFVKTLGNPEGPHALASEWVGSRLAELLGIPTLDFTLIVIEPGTELPMAGGANALPGPAFISRLDTGLPWGGQPEQLASVANRADLANLVVLDTWIRNRDRFFVGPPIRQNFDNVWLSHRAGGRRGYVVTAIDHTHCFGDAAQLTTSLASISKVQDDRVFGLFPAFRKYLDEPSLQSACDRLSRITRRDIAPLIESIPEEWEVSAAVRQVWLDFLMQRTTYVATSLVSKVFP